MTNVKVYSTPICPWCKKTKEFLKENSIEYEEIDVSSNEEASKDMVKKSGQMAVPVIDINGTILVGFDEEKLKKALKL